MPHCKRNREIGFIQSIGLARSIHQRNGRETLAHQLPGLEDAVSEKVPCQHHDDIGVDRRVGTNQVSS